MCASYPLATKEASWELGMHGLRHREELKHPSMRCYASSALVQTRISSPCWWRGREQRNRRAAREHQHYVHITTRLRSSRPVCVSFRPGLPVQDECSRSRLPLILLFRSTSSVAISLTYYLPLSLISRPYFSRQFLMPFTSRSILVLHERLKWPIRERINYIVLQTVESDS